MLKNLWYTFRCLPYIKNHIRGRLYIFRDAPDDIVNWLNEGYEECRTRTDIDFRSDAYALFKEANLEYNLRKSRNKKG